MADGGRVGDSDKVWTVLLTNAAYLPGLLALNHSLRKANSAYPLVVMCTDTVPQTCLDALDARSIPRLQIDYLLPAAGPAYAEDPRFLDCWTKLVPFSLTQYTRVVQLDADMLVRRNMDELMDLPLDEPELAASGAASSVRVLAAGHACVCNPLKKPHYPEDWIPENCAFTSQHDDPDAAQTRGADPAVGRLGFLNGGLQVVNPSKAVFAQIVDYMEANAARMEFADQSVLSDLFRGRWVPLPYTYNALKTLRWEGVHHPIWRDDEVKNVHYILTPKPWEDLDEDGNSRPGDGTHVWWAEMNKDRKRYEREQGIPDDGF